MRDMDRVKEKIEIRLEPRQLATMALGTLLFSGGLFAAGYVVGQRQAPPAPVTAGLPAVHASAQDAAAAVEGPGTPATALGEVEFLFPSMLGSRPARPKPTPKAVRLAPEVVVAPGPATRPAAKDAPAPDVAASDSAASAAAAKAEAARIAAAKADAEREAAARAAQAEREAAAQAEAERVAAAQAKAERQAAAQAEAEAERQAAAQAEAERQAAAQAEAERQAAAQAEAERLAAIDAQKARDRAAAEARTAAAKAEQAARRADEKAKAEQAAAAAKLAAAAKAEDEPGQFTLQVKAVKTRAEVNEFVAGLRAKGFSPKVLLANIPGKGRVYRIRVGQFGSRAEARRFQRRYLTESGQPDGGFITEL